MKNFLEKDNLFIGYAIFGLVFLASSAAAQKPKMATEMPVAIRPSRKD